MSPPPSALMVDIIPAPALSPLIPAGQPPSEVPPVAVPVTVIAVPLVFEEVRLQTPALRTQHITIPEPLVALV